MRGWIVVGGGITGLRAALTLAKVGDVTLITKEGASESNTHYAQGGIAVAMGGAEDVELHGQDTIHAGDGLVFEKAARLLVEEGPARIEELLAWGTHFDREKNGAGELMRTREGAHSLPRILHANGDATGREIGRALLERVAQEPRIHLHERVTMRDLVVRDGRVIGVEALDDHNQPLTFLGSGVLLASGGAGQVYSDTTNPAVATGDGIAVAYRADAEVSDMEFYQFHPTALSVPGAPRFLLSEALRGEGALLRNHRGERFMDRYHPMAELAPRDVVARAIMREGIDERSGEALPVYLDMRHVTGKDLRARFPGISARLDEYGFDLSRDLIPIRPAAHYLMGGVRTDLYGRTNVPGLFAAGEVACTGVHGANRLASNSLLEGLVFGQRAAEAMLEEGLRAEPSMEKDQKVATRNLGRGARRCPGECVAGKASQPDVAICGIVARRGRTVDNPEATRGNAWSTAAFDNPRECRVAKYAHGGGADRSVCPGAERIAGRSRAHRFSAARSRPGEALAHGPRPRRFCCV